MHRYWTRILVALAAVFMLQAAPAAAQATRTWVSGVGDDVNPCSRTAPCKTFAGAISKTAAGGEINCLDPGGFGAVTITKSMTISCSSGTAGVLVSGTNGIVINAGASDSVVLEGLDIVGLGTGLNGVNVLSARDVVIRDVRINGFLDATTGNCVSVGSAAQVRVTIENSLLFNCRTGVSVASTANATAKVYDTLIGKMSVTGIAATGGTNKAEISGVEIYGTPKSLTIAGGAISSYGNNALSGVTTDAPTLIPLQ